MRLRSKERFSPEQVFAAKYAGWVIGRNRRIGAVAANLTQIYFPTSGNTNRTKMEPDNVIKAPSYDFALVAADGDIHSGPRRCNNHGQKLLAK
jgi:hypothetical protein